MRQALTYLTLAALVLGALWTVASVAEALAHTARL